MRDRGLSEEEAEYLLLNDIKEALFALAEKFPWFVHMTQRRQYALANMYHNIGLPRLLGFRKMLQALESKDYETAAVEALDSKWAKQVGKRADEIAQMIKDG